MSPRREAASAQPGVPCGLRPQLPFPDCLSFFHLGTLERELGQPVPPHAAKDTLPLRALEPSSPLIASMSGPIPHLPALRES